MKSVRVEFKPWRGVRILMVLKTRERWVFFDFSGAKLKLSKSRAEKC